MARTPKNSQAREEEEVERGGADAPGLDDIEDDERTVGSRLDEDDEREGDEDELSEEIDLDAMAAMEGPDA